MELLKKIAGFILNPKANLKSLNSPKQPNIEDEKYQAPGGLRSQLTWKEVFTNFPLMLGLIIVAILIFLIIFGPSFATQNPYITGPNVLPHYDSETGEYIQPPFYPSKEYYFGTNQYGADLFSMLLFGARNTLIACLFITFSRILIGVILGGLAGFKKDSLLDKLVMGSIGVLSAIPTLLISMILIYALDISRGLIVFIVALSITGWTEIAQFVRSEFLVLKDAVFIEGAKSIGLRDEEIAIRHILPNILPRLFVVMFLEMGAVLMLLGELAFLGVYVGGGYEAMLIQEIGRTETITMVEEAEWGAMLAEGFRWMRSRPYIIMPSATAFALSVLGFTSLGEGLRNIMDHYSINTSFLLSKKMIYVLGGVALATVYVVNTTGADPWIKQIANQYDGSQAYSYLEDLNSMNGRRAGTEDGFTAAEYIISNFEENELDPGYAKNQYQMEIDTKIVDLLDQPILNIYSNSGEQLASYHHQIDFGFVTESHGGSGDAFADMIFFGFNSEFNADNALIFADLDLREKIVVVIESNLPDRFLEEAQIRGAQAAIIISGDQRDDIQSQYRVETDYQTYLRNPQIPILKVRPDVASKIIESDQLTLSDLFNQEKSTKTGLGWFSIDLSSKAEISVQLSEPREVQIPIVMGYYMGQDLNIYNQLIIVNTSYDGLGNDPDGTVYNNANHNASSVATILEIADLWQEKNMDPRRSILFIAWGDSQLEGQIKNEFIEDPNNVRYLLTPFMSSHVYPTIVIDLDYAGAGGDNLEITSDYPELTKNIMDTFKNIDIEDKSQDENYINELNLSEINTITLRWSDSIETDPSLDTIEKIEENKLEQFGKVVTFILSRMARLDDF